jgi:ketosteroid isomerase-like protein
MAQFSVIALVLVVTTLNGHAQLPAPAATPAAAVEELLQADREFSRLSSATTVANGIAPMLADNVIMPQPGGIFVEGKDAVIATLKKNPRSEKATLTWTPVRGGISADGQHGFTFGYMTMRVPDSADVPMKYLSYWIKTPQGWRVAGYKRAQRPPGEVSLAMLPPALPDKLVPASTDAARIEAFRRSVADAEKAFSDEAQKIGLPAAFRKNGSEDAVNMAGPASPGFVIGATAIGNSMEDGSPPSPSPVSWAGDKAVLVSSSGDLGVTFGIIRTNQPDANGKYGEYAFFTVWRRPTVNDRWLYIAE